MMAMKVGKCPNEELSLTNRVVMNPGDHHAFQGAPHVAISTSPGQVFVFTVTSNDGMARGEVGFSMAQRKWAVLSVKQDIQVQVHRFDESRDYIGAMVLHVDFFNKKKVM